MAPGVPRELVAALSGPQTTLDQASDVIEEHILHRRAKGDSLYQVSRNLGDLEARSQRLAPAIRQAQYLTNVPPPSDLTPPTGPSHTAAASPATLLAYLLSNPTPSVQRSREAILEYVLARESRHRDKKPGKGGKGTLSREALEEISERLGELEDGLRGKGPLVRGSASGNGSIPDEELDESRQTGLALVLSLRMLLSYFTLPNLARQLLCQTPADAERTLVQHIRRRVPGEGRFGVGRELEYVESLTLNRRPALRPAFRSARARTHLPVRAVYPIALPAPSKSACIKLLQAFVRDIDMAGPNAALSYMQGGQQQSTFRTRKSSPRAPNVSAISGPTSPITSPFGSPVKAAHAPLPADSSPQENYTLELISEYLLREKREYMLKNKWQKSGRDQLSKDLADIESALCVASRGQPTKHAHSLLPAFLLLRRTFALPFTPLPGSIVEPYWDMLPAPPDPDSIGLREPTVSSTTASLYVNPRLDDDAALDAIEELLENEREKGINAAVGQEKTIAWLEGLVDQIEKRFPDGSYETVFEQATHIAAHPRVWPDAANSSAFPSHPLVAAEPLGHRRSKSNAISIVSGEDSAMAHPLQRQQEGLVSPVRGGRTHSRSVSMPMRSPSYDDTTPYPRTSFDIPSPTAAKAPRALPQPQPQADIDTYPEERVIDSDVSSEYSISSFREAARGIAKQEESNTHHDDDEGEPSLAGLGLSKVPAPRFIPAPVLSLEVPGPELDWFSSASNDNSRDRKDSAASAASPTSIPSAGAAGGGWWDVVSPVDQSPAAHVPPWVGDGYQSSVTSLNSPPIEPADLPEPSPPELLYSPGHARSTSAGGAFGTLQPRGHDSTESIPTPVPHSSARFESTPVGTSPVENAYGGMESAISPSSANGYGAELSPRTDDEDVSQLASTEALLDSGFCPPPENKFSNRLPSPRATTSHIRVGSSSANRKEANNIMGARPDTSYHSRTTSRHVSGPDPSVVPRPGTTYTTRPDASRSARPDTSYISRPEPSEKTEVAGRSTNQDEFMNPRPAPPPRSKLRQLSVDTTQSFTPQTRVAQSPRTAPLASASEERPMSMPLSQIADEFGAAPKSAPIAPIRDPVSWYQPSEQEPPRPPRRLHGSMGGSAGSRPPPVPITIDRPSFPNSPTALATSPATRAAQTPVEAVSAKTKFGFGRTKPNGMWGGKEKENDIHTVTSIPAATARPTKGRIANNPSQWNRSMVAGIMGPPAERR